MGYLPLDFIKSGEVSMNFFESTKKFLVSESLIDENTTEEEYMDFLLSRDFFSFNYNGKFKKLNNYLMTNLNLIMEMTGCSFKDIEAGNISVKTEWLDFLAAGVITDNWAKNKQVYKLDKEFGKALISTEKLQLTKNQIEHLPSNLFYIDLSDCDYFAPIHGAWCNVKLTGNYVNVYIMMLRNDLIFFSWYSEGLFSKDGILDIEKPDNPSKEFITYIPDYEEKSIRNIKTETSTIKKSDIAMLCLQMLGYLTSKEPDIEENPVTKSTYKPSKTIKNKFSEIQQRDVGIRYGKSIRIKMKEIKHKEKGSNKEDSEKSETKIIHRKPPKPHFRNAHWSHYWTGKGRTNYETRWIEPTFVGFNDNNYESDVIIHKVVD